MTVKELIEELNREVRDGHEDSQVMIYEFAGIVIHGNVRKLESVLFIKSRP